MATPGEGRDHSSSRRRSHHRHHSSGHRRRRTSESQRRPSFQETTSPSQPHYHLSPPSPLPPSPLPSPGARYTDRDPMMGQSDDIQRKRSLVRPERRRQDSTDPQYYYRKHAQNMNVHPSTTGNDPLLYDQDRAETVSSQSTDLKSLGPGRRRTTSEEKPYGGISEKHAYDNHGGREPLNRNSTKRTGKLSRKNTKTNKHQQETVKPPSLWNVYCAIITFWCPDAVLKTFGKVAKAQQRAWREKMGLISIILLICAFVGFLTFGFTQAVCPEGGPLRLRVNHVDLGYMIFHGAAYDLSRSQHTLARGIPDYANVLFDLPEKHGGQDGSFLFQNVNGNCKGLISATPNSKIPTDSEGNLAWYQPCLPFNQDGSTPVNYSTPYYNGWACHTSDAGRDAFYSLTNAGDVYYTWDDVKNTSRNLMVYGDDVLDLNLIDWFDQTQVTLPSEFESLKNNPDVRGVDVTLAFTTDRQKQIAKCLTETVKVGSIDTATIGCIASQVVLYVSLIFILSIVAVKFVLALAFQWFLCRKFSAETSPTGDSKRRNQQIEDWSDDIYRPPPKLSDPTTSSAGDRSSKRGSAFLPQTSRFTSPYAIERAAHKKNFQPTTMASQNSNRLGGPSNEPYQHGNQSQVYDSIGKSSADRSSTYAGNTTRFSMAGEIEGPGPAGFVHEAVVPQPPSEWQPFGYPLAHTICLVTAYSEGMDGLRTTLDSVATTEYPNSHKLMLIICDGIIKGKGEDYSTPEVALSMMKDHAIPEDEVQAFSYVAVASGSKRHNMAKIYAGFYDYGDESMIPLDKQQRIPMMVIVKTGTPDEAKKSKPGNRGKRDSQIILMSFLQKVMFDERMTELEFEMFNGIWKITGISPDFYEIVLMVDADTKVFPDCLTHMVSAMVKDPEIMGLCGETKIANKRDTWVSMIQVFEYFISHHLAKSFESVFGGVTCLPGCFCMYRIKAPKGGQNYWVPILANPDVVEHYSENVVDTLHKKNLLLLGEDRYLSTLMLKTFPKRKQVFVPQAVCKTTVPEQFRVLLSQRRRWINSTVHNLMELVLVRDLCGTFCFSMQFVVFIELVGTLVLPAAIAFTLYVVAIAIKAGIEHTAIPTIPLVLLALILGLPAVLIVLTAHRFSYVAWMLIYLLSLPIWNFVLPTYAYWKFDDFSWGDTRKTAGEKVKKAGIEYEGEFDSSKITMKRWGDFEQERRLRASHANAGWTQQQNASPGVWPSREKGGFDPLYDN